MTKVNKIKNYEKIMNLICKIEKIKEDIFTCQRLNLNAEITVKDLKKMNFPNNTLLLNLETLENEYNQNMKYVTDYNNSIINLKKNLKKKYEKISEKNLLKEYNEYINKENLDYNKTYNDLQKKLRDLEYTRLDNVKLNNKYKIKMDIILDDIKLYKAQVLILQNNILKIDNELYDDTILQLDNTDIQLEGMINKECAEELKILNQKYDEKSKKQKGGTTSNSESITKIKPVITKEKPDKVVKKIEKVVKKEENILFLEKYYSYLEEFDELCKRYMRTDSDVPMKSIIFTDEQVNNKIEELENINKEFNSGDYEKIDEEYVEHQYKKKLETKKTKYDLKKKEHKEIINLKLSGIQFMIKKYEEMDKFNTRDENIELIENLNKEKFDLKRQIDQLESTYLDKYEVKINFNHNCKREINKLKQKRIDEIYKNII